MYSPRVVRCSKLLRLQLFNRASTRQLERTLVFYSQSKDNIQTNRTYKNIANKLLHKNNKYNGINVLTQQVRFYSLPPHTKIELPALSPTMEMGTIASWVIKEGESFEAGDLLAEIETDKATVGFEAQDEGYLAKILVPEGTKDIALGTLIAIAVEEEEHVLAFKDYTPDTDTPTNSKQSSTKETTIEQANVGQSVSDLPRHERVTLPALSPTMTTGTIAKWAVKVGDKIEEGDLLADIETDKATMAMDAEEEGYVAKILLEEGTKDIPLGTLLCIMVENEDDISKFANFTDTAPSSTPAAQPKAEQSIPSQSLAQPPVKTITPTTPPIKRSGDRVFASPFAKKLASEKGYDLSQIQGSGPNGRVRGQDVLQFTPTKEKVDVPSAVSSIFPIPSSTITADNYIDIPLNKFREVTAKRLLESKNSIPHYYLTVDCAMDNLLEMRKQFNNDLKDSGAKLSVNDFIIKAAALACLKVPEANSSWQDTFIRQYNKVDVSIAVNTDNGLITPIIFNADGKGLVDISKNVGNLASKARDGKLQPSEFMGGTFTVSNLGMFGIKHFTAIINPPQACILAVGSARKELVPDADSENGLSEATMMSVTLSCDHRVVDGAVGALWLQHFKKFLQNPNTMLL